MPAGPTDPNRLDTWLAIHAENTATIFIGFVELGQGVPLRCYSSLPRTRT